MARTRKPDAVPTTSPIDETVIDQLAGEATTMAEVEAIFRQMKQQVMERIRRGELSHHLGSNPGEEQPAGHANHRTGATPETVLTEDGPVSLAPLLIPKHARRLPRFDDTVRSLDVRGMTVREIQGHLEALYQVEISPDVISTVPDEVLGVVREWQDRPLDAVYPVVVLDALRVKMRDAGVVRNRAVHVALGIRSAGQKEVLGLWIEQTEGAAFWHRVRTALSHRGVQDMLIALIDGLTGFPTPFPRSFPRRRAIRAWGIACDRAWPTSRGRIARRWRPPSARSFGSRARRHRLGRSARRHVRASAVTER